jgi:uncharacterized protein
MTQLQVTILTCPACGGEFEDTVVGEVDSLDGLNSDFEELHLGGNPTAFYAHLCPHCLYVATDFSYAPTLATKKYLQSPLYIAGIDNPRDGRASTKYILLARLQRSALIAAHQVAYNYLRASWFARAEGDVQRCIECRRNGIDLYEKALRAGMVPGPGRAAIHYVVGELYRLMGEFEKADLWFGQAAEFDWRSELVARQRELVRQRSVQDVRMPEPAADGGE